MVLSKKAVVFTLIAILISTFLFLLYATEYSPKEDKLLPVVINRVHMLDRYNENFLKYVEEATDVSSFKAMNGMVAYADAHGFFSDFEPAFLECVQNGTLGGGANPCPDMENGTLPYWLDQIVNISQGKIRINITYTLQGMQVKQPLPFQIEVGVGLHYEIEDVFARINRTLTVKRLVNVEGLMDPLYVVLGTYNNSISSSPTRDDQWNNDTLYFMIHNRTYRAHGDAPNLINRFEGVLLNSSCCGIESMIHPDEPIGAYQNQSFVDYLFWNGTSFCGGIPIQVVYWINEPAYGSKFRLEPRHLVAYNIDSSTWVSGCT